MAHKLIGYEAFAQLFLLLMGSCGSSIALGVHVLPKRLGQATVYCSLQSPWTGSGLVLAGDQVLQIGLRLLGGEEHRLTLL